MANNALLNKLKQKQDQVKKDTTQQKPTITSPINENKGRPAKYLNSDDVRNVNGFVFKEDYVYFCDLAYTLQITHTILINKLLDNLYNYLDNEKVNIDYLFLKGIAPEKSPSECVKKNFRFFRDQHLRYQEIRKTDRRTVAEFFECAVELYRHQNPDLKVFRDPVFRPEELKVVSMKGKVRFK